MRGSHAAALALLLGWSAALGAAPPDAPASLSAAAGDIVEVVVKVPAKAEIGYRLVGGKALFRELKTDSPNERVFWFNSKTDGTYAIVWWTKGETQSSETVVTVGAAPGPAPKPKPKPDPDPPKPDPVKVDRVFVAVVEQAGQPRTAETGRVLNDPFWYGLHPTHSYRHYLSDGEAKRLGYTAIAEKVGYPAVVILPADGGPVLRSFRLSTIDEIKTAVKEVTK